MKRDKKERMEIENFWQRLIEPILVICKTVSLPSFVFQRNGFAARVRLFPTSNESYGYSPPDCSAVNVIPTALKFNWNPFTVPSQFAFQAQPEISKTDLDAGTRNTRFCHCTLRFGNIVYTVTIILRALT